MNVQELNTALEILLEDLMPLNEMANFRKSTFNLLVNIWVDGPRNLKHSKRIKFQNNYSDKFDETNLVSTTIEDNPKVCRVFKKIQLTQDDIDKLIAWVRLNKDTLLEYGEGGMATEELITRLKSL